MPDLSNLPPAIPSRPAIVTGAVREAWDAIAPKLLAAGNLTVLDGGVLTVLCTSWCLYLEALEDQRLADSDETRALYVGIVASFHHSARDAAAQMKIIPHDRVPLTPLNADGIDADLVDWFRP